MCEKGRVMGKGKRSSNELHIQRYFNWDDFDRVRKGIFALTQKVGYDSVTLNFKSTKVIFPNGITPLIALVNSYQRDGIEFSLIPPASVDLNKIARFEGWFHAIDPARFDPPAKSGYNNLPLIKFANDDELNDGINLAIEVALRQLSMAKNVSGAFEWSINELSGNVLHHASADGYLQVNSFKKESRLSIVIADAGVGVPASMRERFPDIPNDRIAVEQAVQKGITSKPNFGQGNGLAGCMAIAMQSDGYFSLTSGGGRMQVSAGRVSFSDFFPKLPGTVVEMQLPTNSEIDLPGALWGHVPSTYIEERYEDDGGTLHLKLKGVAPTFGNRLTGEKVRTLINNLLQGSPAASLEIDFEGVNIIASSFADEVFGKLFLGMGPMEFGQRVRFVSVNGTCKELINSAITERMQQAKG